MLFRLIAKKIEHLNSAKSRLGIQVKTLKELIRALQSQMETWVGNNTNGNKVDNCSYNSNINGNRKPNVNENGNGKENSNGSANGNENDNVNINGNGNGRTRQRCDPPNATGTAY